jgi:hypothetical protein
MNIANQNLILDATNRINRKAEKQFLVLRFLRQHLWSTQLILQTVLKLQSRQATHKSLCQMQQAGLVKSHVFNALGGKITLWGITAHGQIVAFIPEHEEPYSAYFEPSRISEQMMRHQLDLQMIRIKAEELGWTNWLDGDRLGQLENDAKRPDATVLNESGLKVAIECERTFKTTKRYEQILLSYLRLLKNGVIKEVIWVSPSEDFSKRLKVLITSIKKLKVAGQFIQIDPNKHHANLYFCTYEDWPNYV